MKKSLLFVLLLVSGITSAVTLKNIVVFGDSLSDNGNLYEYMQHQLPSSPPYFDGRFSNGPVWVERLASAYYPESPKQHLLDYAFGGASVSEDPHSEVLLTLQHEVDSYLLSHQDKADPDSLFIIWMGANNYLGLPDNVDQTIQLVNDGIKQSLQRLSNLGAKHILVINLPNLGQSPYAKLVGGEALLTQYTDEHNKKLLGTIHQLEQDNPAVQWLHFDVNAMLNTVLIAPESYGFKNVEETCYESMIESDLTTSPRSSQGMFKPSMIRVASQIKLNSKEDNCEGYLFFDPVHPASLAHTLIANHIHELLASAGLSF